MPEESSTVDDRYRSLLQKAVRRGHPELVSTISALIEDLNIHSRGWFEKRAAFIVFSECWPFGCDMLFTKRFPSKVAALIRVARARKARDATGLGLLAYALAQGETSVLNQSAEDHAKRSLRNKAVRSAIKTVVKKVETAVASGKKEEAGNELAQSIKILTKAASKGVIHRNTASRNISRLTRKVNTTPAAGAV